MNKPSTYADSPVLAELYDLVPAYINRPDKEFYRRMATGTTGKILELGCGTGRVLLPIAEAGHDITGMDISEHMLSQCRRKLDSYSQNVGERVRLIHGDMKNFAIDDLFRLAIIPFRAFQHLINIEDQISCLRAINRHLAMKSRLVIDFFNVDFNRVSNPRFSHEIVDFDEFELEDGRRLKRTYRTVSFHQAEQYNVVELIYHLTDTDGETKRFVHGFPFRYFFRYEVEHLLARCGFEIVGLFGDFDESPLSNDSPEMIFVAEKNREF